MCLLFTFRTEECTKTVEQFSAELENNVKKFDRCTEIYEILNEKTKIRFNEIDKLLMRTATIESE